MKIDFRKKPVTFLISRNLKLVGDINGTISGRIEGIVRGDIAISGKVIIGDSAVVIGNIRANEIEVFGKIQGNILAYISVHMGPGSKIEGEIIAVSIEIHKHALIDGDVKKMKLSEVKTIELPRKDIISSLSKEKVILPVIKKEIPVRKTEEANSWW